MKNARHFVFELNSAGSFMFEGIGDDKEIDRGQQDYVRRLVEAAQLAVAASGKPVDHFENVIRLAEIGHIINSLSPPAAKTP